MFCKIADYFNVIVYNFLLDVYGIYVRVSTDRLHTCNNCTKVSVRHHYRNMMKSRIRNQTYYMLVTFVPKYFFSMVLHALDS